MSVPRQRRVALVSAIAVALAVSSLSGAFAYPRPGRTERVSEPTGGGNASGQFEPNFATDITDDGRLVVFEGWSSKLAPEHDDGGPAKAQVYIRDRATGITELASMNAVGVKADSHSGWGVITPDARYIAFSSLGRNLAPGSSRGAMQIYLRDRVTGSVERVSVNAAGEAGAAPGAFTRADSEVPSISSDARYIAFDSRATNLVTAPDLNGSERDIYLRDRVDNVTERVSVDSEGLQLPGESYMPHVSNDGRHVAFGNLAPELSDAVRIPPREATIWRERAYLHDRETGETILVSVASDGSSADSDAQLNSMTPDGRFVVFSSDASNLVPVTTAPEVVPDCSLSSEEGGFVCREHGAWNVYVHDRDTGITERVSVTDSGAQGNGASSGGFISDDGRFVVFLSGATNFVAGDTNGGADIFVHDRLIGTTERVSISNDGGQIVGDCGEPTRMSADGRFPAFTCFGGGLIANSASDGIDAYVRDRGPILGIGRLDAVSSDSSLMVSGWASFTGAELSRATDPVGDDSGMGAERGADLVATDVVFRAEDESLLTRWHLAELPGEGAPGVVYGLRFTVDEVRYEIRGSAVTADDADFALYRCDPACITQTPLPASFGEVGTQVWATLSLADSPARPGEILSEISAYTATGTASSGPLRELDATALSSAEVPGMRVEVAAAPHGTPAHEVPFEPAALSDGFFNAELDLGDGGASLMLWARACLGNVCEAVNEPLGDQPEPTPSGSTSPTPDPTVSPTASPSGDPVPEGTHLVFTERSATAGQYSDETVFEAELTDSDGDPISGVDLTFELTGADSARDFVATTDADGLATVTPTLAEQPGSHQLTVRFAGDDDHAPSANSTAFVVDKEDSVLELTVEGKGNNRILIARLADEDTPSAGIVGRTIDFYGDGEFIGFATTDDDGVATLKPPPRYRGGKHDFEARFESDDYYLGSSDEMSS